MIVFSEASKDQIKILKLILYSFELMTRLEINFEKTKLIGIGLSSEKVSGYARILGKQILPLICNLMLFCIPLLAKLRLTDLSIAQLGKRIDQLFRNL